MARFYKRRISYLPTFFSISLVLFLAGFLGFLVFDVRMIKDDIKENVELNIYFKDSVQQPQIETIRKHLASERFVKDARYISKEEGAKLWPMGAEGIKLLGFNPIPNAIEVHFNSGFVSMDSINDLKSSLEKNPGIRDIQFNEDVVKNLDQVIRTSGIVLLSLVLLFALVSIALINNAIRLNMYSRRFLIKSMQLVGATKNFIRRPFIMSGVITGICSAVFAGIILLALIYFGYRFMPFPMSMYFWAHQKNYVQVGIIMLGMVIAGVLISGMSSYFAINKYLKLKLDDLF